MKIITKDKKWKLVFFITLFCILYVFFRYVHPVVPWDGDDWRTIGTNLSCFEHGFPQFGLAHKESERIMCSLLGGFFGYLAAFFIYPITNDYVCSFVVIAAFCLAFSVTVVIYFVFELLAIQNKKYVYLATIVFVVSGFIIFKNTYPSTYLFWQFNYCTIYYYSIPSYLASAFALYLISKYIKDDFFGFDIKTGCLLILLYFLMFSFLPAGLLVAVISFSIVLMFFIKNKSLKHLLRRCWFHIVALILFGLKVFFELFSEFSSGYFSQPTDVLPRLKSSFEFIFLTFFNMNKLFILFALSVLILTFAVCFKKEKNNDADNKKTMWKKTFLILLISILLVFCYFTFFGVISFDHLHKGNLPVRMDSMYVFYFLIIMLVVSCFVYVLSYIKQAVIVMPLIVAIMTVTMISPANHYSDSFYTDTTPTQRYTIMSKIVEEIKLKDAQGANNVVVHMPQYNHYGGPGMGYDLYLHNITNKHISIEFIYEDGIHEVYCE